jgi:hypothetical protein
LGISSIVIEIYTSAQSSNNLHLHKMPRRTAARPMGHRPLHYDGIDVLPVTDFLSQLHAGEIY